MSSDTDSAERLARGLPIRAVLDTSSAEAWIALDVEVRTLAARSLGECGSRADAETLWALVAHPLPAVRLHAVTGLRALDAVTRERLRPLLDDPSSAVVRAATRALLPDAAGFPQKWLLERTAPDRPRPVRVAAQRLLRARLGAPVSR